MDIGGFLRKEFMPQDKTTRSGRNLYFDFLKVLAAFLTVFYHFSYYTLDYGFVAESTSSYLPNVSRILMCFSACCVPLFFIINGALMFSRKRSIKDVYFKALKILILIFLWRFAGFPSWFFRTLFFLYLAFPLLQWLYTKHRKVIVALCVAVFIFPFLYNFVLTAIKGAGIEAITLPLCTINVSSLSVTGAATGYSLLYFLLGPILKEMKTPKPLLSVITILTGWALVVAECTIYTNINDTMYDGVNIAFPTVGALLLSMGVFTLAKNFTFTKIQKPLGFISGGILHIYLMHVAFINLFSIMLHGLPSNLFLCYLGSVVVFMLCVLVGKVADRIPVICWFFKM